MPTTPMWWSSDGGWSSKSEEEETKSAKCPASTILDPDQNKLNEEEIANLKAELKEQVESRQELDASIAKKMKRLKL